MKTSRTFTGYATVLFFVSIFMTACTEPPIVATDEFAEIELFSSKRDCSVEPAPNGCKDNGGNSEGEASTAMYADYQTSVGGPLPNEIIVTNVPGTEHSGGRLGGGWATGFGVIWDGTDFVFTDHKATAPPNCPAGGTFGVLEANMKAGKVTTIWLRGNSADGVSWSSDKISVDTQIPDNGGWLLTIGKDVVVHTGKGQSQERVCTVFLNDILFSLVEG